MARVSEMYPSKWLAAADLQGREIQVQINRVAFEEIGSGDDRETKPVVYFVGKEKGLVLNKTNANNIAIVHGDDTDMWIGKAVILFTAWVDFQGRSVEAVRARGLPAPLQNDPVPPPQPGSALAPGTPAGPFPTGLPDGRPTPPDDDIPF